MTIQFSSILISTGGHHLTLASIACLFLLLNFCLTAKSLLHTVKLPPKLLARLLRWDEVWTWSKRNLYRWVWQSRESFTFVKTWCLSLYPQLPVTSFHLATRKFAFSFCPCGHWLLMWITKFMICHPLLHPSSWIIFFSLAPGGGVVTLRWICLVCRVFPFLLTLIPLNTKLLIFKYITGISVVPSARGIK